MQLYLLFYTVFEGSEYAGSWEIIFNVENGFERTIIVWQLHYSFEPHCFSMEVFSSCGHQHKDGLVLGILPFFGR